MSTQSNVSSLVAAARMQAATELEEERMRELVDIEKQKIRAARWWHLFVPVVTITIAKRKP